jgi:hypothetical protein
VPRLGRVLLDDFRHDEQAVGSGWRVAEGLFVGEARPEFVGAGYVDEWKGMGGGFDIADIDFFEFFYVTENIAQLRADFLFFFRSQSQTGQVGNVFDVDIGASHVKVT